MAVWCRQRADGTPEQVWQIEPHYAGQTDAELLEAKYQGARAKGWRVRRSKAGGFTATKLRWEGVTCTRTFWIE